MRISYLLRAIIALALLAVPALGVSSAAAEDEIVFCKQLIEKGSLCPAGKLWPAGTVILGLAKEPVLKNSIATIKCEDSVLRATIGTTPANPLPVSITELSSGKLPTPELGAGCTTCTSGLHVNNLPLGGQVEVESLDDFFFRFGATFTSLNCFGLGINCTYGSASIRTLIEHTGVHPLHEGNNLPAILINATVNREAGSSGFCPATQTWEACYVFTLFDFAGSGESGLGWPALDEK